MGWVLTLAGLRLVAVELVLRVQRQLQRQHASAPAADAMRRGNVGASWKTSLSSLSWNGGKDNLLRVSEDELCQCAVWLLAVLYRAKNVALA